MSMVDPFRENADRAFEGADHGELLRAGELNRENVRPLKA